MSSFPDLCALFPPPPPTLQTNTITRRSVLCKAVASGNSGLQYIGRVYSTLWIPWHGFAALPSSASAERKSCQDTTRSLQKLSYVLLLGRSLLLCCIDNLVYHMVLRKPMVETRDTPWPGTINFCLLSFHSFLSFFAIANQFFQRSTPSSRACNWLAISAVF